MRQALTNRGLPFRVKDDTDFLKQPEIKTALAYLYIINNISDPVARGTEGWWRLFHYNNALSQEDSIRIGEFIKKNWCSFQEAIYHHIDEPGLTKSGLGTINNVKQRLELLCEKKSLDVSDLVLEVFDISSLSRQFSHTDTIKDREALLNLRKLHEMAENFEKMHGKDLSTFIDYLEILDEMGGNPPSARIEDEDAIKLMSIHAAKGLEWKVVFLTNMAKERFPLYRGGREPLIPPELLEQYRDRVRNNLMVEKRFTVPLGGFTFKGFIDRVDLIPGTKDEVEIIDYKTGKYEPGPDERSKQLLLYARGLMHICPQYRVKKLTLELLAHPSPRTFELKDGEYVSGNSRVDGLDKNAVDSLIETAKKIAHDYEHGFQRTTDENTCRECGYRLYCGE